MPQNNELHLKNNRSVSIRVNIDDVKKMRTVGLEQLLEASPELIGLKLPDSFLFHKVIEAALK